ncbi:MAG: hypothetical protein JWQ79_2763 [Mucilaginibacter sp.]|jgi:hypothetical protein|nr:hypothetical protein [Mucilaginibacter sp.]
MDRPLPVGKWRIGYHDNILKEESGSNNEFS